MVSIQTNVHRWWCFGCCSIGFLLEQEEVMRYQWMTLKDVLRSLHAMDVQGVSEVARGKKDSTQTKEGFVEAYIATNGLSHGPILQAQRDLQSGSKRNQNSGNHMYRIRIIKCLLTSENQIRIFQKLQKM